MTDRSSRPLIGISIGRYADSRGRVYTQLPESYAIAVAAAGGAPVLVPPLEDRAALDRIFSTLDGMLFPGGGDVHPRFYADEMAGSVSPDETLDAAEIALAGWAADREVPTLGI